MSNGNHLDITIKSQIVSEDALLLSFGDAIDKRLPQHIAKINARLSQHFDKFIVDAIPSYTTLLVYIDLQKTDIQLFQQKTDDLLAGGLSSDATQTGKNKLIEIPVFYHEKVGPDLTRIASNTELDTDEIIQLHHSKIYTVFTIGFAPGFAYLGNVDIRIAEPRLPTPRQLVPKGSVGIAGQQTGIYPQTSPGGWNIIGRTPIALIRCNDDGTLDCPFQAGDNIQFIPITEQQFIEAGGNVSPWPS